MHGRHQDAESIRTRVTKMAKAGRVTAEEADRVSSAANAEELERAVGEIRARHARVRLDTDVAEGRMTESEADLFIERLKRGEDPRPPSWFRRRKPMRDGAAPDSIG